MESVVVLVVEVVAVEVVEKEEEAIVAVVEEKGVVVIVDVGVVVVAVVVVVMEDNIECGDSECPERLGWTDGVGTGLMEGLDVAKSLSLSLHANTLSSSPAARPIKAPEEADEALVKLEVLEERGCV